MDSESNQIPGPHRSEFNCLHSSNKMEASFALQGTKSSFSLNYAFHAILRKKSVEAHQFYYLMKSLLT